MFHGKALNTATVVCQCGSGWIRVSLEHLFQKGYIKTSFYKRDMFLEIYLLNEHEHPINLKVIITGTVTSGNMQIIIVHVYLFKWTLINLKLTVLNKIDGGNTNLWNVGILPQHYAVLQPRRPWRERYFWMKLTKMANVLNRVHSKQHGTKSMDI
jgi:hypothetical protein